MYNSALVMQQQMQAIGINAQLKVVDWPTSVGIMAQEAEPGWNFFFTGWGTQPALGALATMQFFVPPNAGLQAAGRQGRSGPDQGVERHEQHAGPEGPSGGVRASMQKLILEQGLRRAVRFADQGAGACGPT